MTKFIWAAAIVTLVGTASGLQAQPAVPGRPIGQVPPPTVSPYLNLLRPGSSQAINYYGLVRPQVEFQQSIQALQSQVGFQQAQDMFRATEPGVTGHSVYFLNYGGYFQSMTGRPTAPAGIGVGNRTGIGMPTTAAGFGVSRPTPR